jgi:ATP-binding cassette subfamily C protein
MKEYLVFLNKNRLSAIFYLIVSVFGGTLEALGLISLVPALEAITDNSSGAILLLAIPLATLIGAIVFRYLGERLQALILARTEAGLREELVSQIFFSPWQGVRKLSQGQITSGVVSEASQIANGVFAFLNAFGAAVLVAVLWAAAFFVNPSMALITSLFLVVIGAILRLRLKIFKTVESGLRAGYQNVSEQVSGLLSEIKFIRLSSQKMFWFIEIGQQTSRLSDNRRKQIVLPATNRAIVESTASIFLIVSLGVIAIQGVPISQGIVFMGVFYRLVPRLQSLQGYISTSVGQRIWLTEWLKRRAALGGSFFKGDAGEYKPDPIPDSPERGSDIKISSITVIENEVEILNAVNLDVASGSFLVITGRTGVGKTTLVDAMLGLRPAEAGRVFLDSTEITGENLEAHLGRVSVITQDVPIFAGTIDSNITCGYALDETWRDQVVDVACLTSFLNNQPQAYLSELSSKGLSMSGGERQRLGIARALYQKPALLILDEATNGLDEKTEMDVIRAIRALPWKITIIAISHRSSLFDLADRVVQLENGKLFEINRGYLS